MDKAVGISKYKVYREKIKLNPEKYHKMQQMAKERSKKFQRNQKLLAKESNEFRQNLEAKRRLINKKYRDKKLAAKVIYIIYIHSFRHTF
jgi:hypothetical protein